MVELQRMRWYNPKGGSFEWREVPKSYEDALSLLGGSPYTQSCTDTYLYWHGSSPASGRASLKRRAQPASGPLTVWFQLHSGAVFFGRPPYLFRIDVIGEAGHHRPVCTA